MAKNRETDSDPPVGADGINLGVSALVASVEKEEKEAGESLVGTEHDQVSRSPGDAGVT